jgi:hypothetical protein
LSSCRREGARSEGALCPREVFRSTQVQRRRAVGEFRRKPCPRSSEDRNFCVFVDSLRFLYIRANSAYAAPRMPHPTTRCPDREVMNPTRHAICTTTYATTYGWVSTGIRRELMARPPSEKRLGREQTGPDGTKGKDGTSCYESEGRRFESCRACYIKRRFAGILALAKRLTV